MLPDMTSCPRGSNIRARRTQSWSRMKICRFSAIGTFGNSGAPPATTRTGLPQVWASIQKKVWRAMFVLSSRVIARRRLASWRSIGTDRSCRWIAAALRASQ